MLGFALFVTTFATICNHFKQHIFNLFKQHIFSYLIVLNLVQTCKVHVIQIVIYPFLPVLYVMKIY